MSTKREGRTAIVRPETAKQLQEILGFRHVVRSLYGFELNPNRIARLIDIYPNVWAQTHLDIQQFVIWLRELAKTLDGD